MALTAAAIAAVIVVSVCAVVIVGDRRQRGKHAAPSMLTQIRQAMRL